MSRISDLIDEIKIYNICDHCDHYDTTKRCRIGDEGCNCKEEVERQIVAEIRTDAIKDFADWLVKYKVISDSAMHELIRDFEGEMNND